MGKPTAQHLFGQSWAGCGALPVLPPDPARRARTSPQRSRALLQRKPRAQAKERRGPGGDSWAHPVPQGQQPLGPGVTWWLGPSGPWHSSAPVSPTVSRWLLPARPQLPSHRDMSLGGLAGTSEQGGGTSEPPAAPTRPVWVPMGEQCGSPSALPRLCSAAATSQGILHAAGLMVGCHPALLDTPRTGQVLAHRALRTVCCSAPRAAASAPNASHACNE